MPFAPVTLVGGDHQVVRLVTHGRAAALRLPHQRPDHLILQARLAGALLGDQSGVGPRYLASDTASGVMLVEWINGVSVRAPLSVNKASIAHRLGEALRHVHATVAPADMLAANLVSLAKSLNPPKIILDIAEALTATQTELCPSHGDLVPDNVLIEPANGVRLIDWDYAALHDPCWDLAYAIQELGLNIAESDALFAGYGRAMPAQRMILFRTLIVAINTAWRQANQQTVSKHALELAQILSTHDTVSDALGSILQQAGLTGRGASR